MPESTSLPLSNAELHRRALASGYQINVLPQAAHASFGSGETTEIVDTESAWQWSVRYRTTALASGHSCASPQMAFEQALSALRGMVPEAEGALANRFAAGGFTYIDSRPVTYTRIAPHMARPEAPRVDEGWNLDQWRIRALRDQLREAQW